MQMYIRKIILRCNVFELARLLCENTKFAKKFNAKKDWIGELIVWDGINFEIEFRLDDKS